MKAKLQLTASMAIFGTIALFVRAIEVSSATLALMRAVIAAVFILTLRAAKKNPVNFRSMGRDALPLMLSGAAMGFNWILLFEAYKYTTVSIATLSYYFAPVIVMVVSAMLFREKMTPMRVLCFVGSTVGLVLVIGLNNLAGGANMTGILFGLGAAVLYASVILLNKRIRSVGGTDRTVLQFLAAIIVLLPYILLTEGIHLGQLTLTGIACLAVVGLIHTGLAYIMYFSALPNLRGQEAAILSYVDPLVAVVLSCTVLGETTTALQLIGGAMILAFTLLNELKGEKS